MISVRYAHKNARKSRNSSFIFIITVVLFVVLVQHTAVENGNAAVTALAGSGSLKGTERLVDCLPDTPSGVSAVFAEGMEIRSGSSLLFLRSGTARTNKFHGDGNGALKKILGWIFAPLFYCFYHPPVFLCVGLCLSILFALLGELKTVERKGRRNRKGNRDMFEWN